MKSSNNMPKNRFGGPFVALLGLFVTAFSCTSARAQSLFDNGPADPGVPIATGFFADTGFSGGFFAAGDVFTPTANGTANSIKFAGFYDNNGVPTTTKPADSFTIYLFSVTPGTPDAPNVEISQATLTNETSSLFATSGDGFPMYQFSGNLTTSTPFALNTATEYFVGISDTTTPSSEFALDVTVGSTGPAMDGWQLASASSPAGGNTPNGVAFAFSLSSSVVPEPSTWAMLGAGVLGLFVYGWGRTRRTLP